MKLTFCKGKAAPVVIYTFLTLALDGDEWLASHPGHFISVEKPPLTHWIGGWVGPRASLDAAPWSSP